MKYQVIITRTIEAKSFEEAERYVRRQMTVIGRPLKYAGSKDVGQVVYKVVKVNDRP